MSSNLISRNATADVPVSVTQTVVAVDVGKPTIRTVVQVAKGLPLTEPPDGALQSLIVKLLNIKLRFLPETLGA